jgi:hypothetical protein
MLRFLGVVLLLIAAVVGLGFYMGWFTISKEGDKTNITVNQDKIKADEEAAKKKAEDLAKKAKEKVESATDKK